MKAKKKKILATKTKDGSGANVIKIFRVVYFHNIYIFLPTVISKIRHLFKKAIKLQVLH